MDGVLFNCPWAMKGSLYDSAIPVGVERERVPGGRKPERVLLRAKLCVPRNHVSARSSMHV